MRGLEYREFFAEHIQPSLADSKNPIPQSGTAYSPPSSPYAKPQRDLKPHYDYDTDTARSIVDRYVKAGYDPRFAVGMAANAVAESSLNPSAFNKREGARGLFQWRGDRLTGLTDFADRMGKSINDLNTQIDFSIDEFRGAERVAFSRIQGNDPESAADYARLIDKHYERSAGIHTERRAQIAAQMYNEFFGDGATHNANYRPDNDTSGDSVAGVPDDRSEARPSDTTSPQAANVPSAIEPTGGPVGSGANIEDPTRDPAAVRATLKAVPKGKLSAYAPVLLALANGLQSLSRGTTADYATPIQMSMNERQRQLDTQYRVSEQERQQRNVERREHRLDRAQALSEGRFSFEKEQYGLRQSRDARRAEIVGKIATDAGLESAAALAEGGFADDALKVYNRWINQQGDAADFDLGESATEAAASRAEAMGRNDIAATLRSDEATPKAKYLAAKQAFQLKPEKGTGVRDNATYDQIIKRIPKHASPTVRNRVELLAEGIASGEDGLWDDLSSTLAEAKVPGAEFADNIINSDIARRKETSGSHASLLRTAEQIQDIAANPSFDSGALRSQLLNPITRWTRDVVGEEAANAITGVDSVDLIGQQIFRAMRSGAIGDLAEGFTGQLSNKEVDLIIRQLGDDTVTPVEMLALSQIMRKKIEAERAAYAAAAKYVSEVGGRHNVDISEYERVKQEAAAQHKACLLYTSPSPRDPE